MCVGIVEDKILITKEGKLRNFENKKNQIPEKKTLSLLKKPVKESLIFDKSFEANNAKNTEKTKFEFSLLYSTIRQKIQGQGNLKYEDKEHIFLFGSHKLNYYWDNKKKQIYFFQYYTGKKACHSELLKENDIKTLKNGKECVVHEVQSINQETPVQNVVNEKLKSDVEENKSCCQKCCDNCF